MNVQLAGVLTSTYISDLGHDPVSLSRSSEVEKATRRRHLTGSALCCALSALTT